MKQEPREHLDGHVVVWRAQVSTSLPALPCLQRYLDDKDLARAARFRFPEDRARYVLGRAMVRESIGRYLHREPESLALKYTNRGRPVLADDDAIQFNISHARDWVVIALTSRAQIGIDLEYLRADLCVPEMAVSILSAEDLQRFRALPRGEKLASFFRAWTRKEAYLKATGEGITEALKAVSVSFGPEEVATLHDSRPNMAHQPWRLLSLPLPENYAGSLACDDFAKKIDYRLVRFEQNEMITEP
jgi:4'-phosphopantetheinyl transferase